MQSLAHFCLSASDQNSILAIWLIMLSYAAVATLFLFFMRGSLMHSVAIVVTTLVAIDFFFYLRLDETFFQYLFFADPGSPEWTAYSSLTGAANAFFSSGFYLFAMLFVGAAGLAITAMLERRHPKKLAARIFLWTVIVLPVLPLHFSEKGSCADPMGEKVLVGELY